MNPKTQRKGEPCRHCQKAPIHKPRNLCYNCYMDLSIRNLYPVSVKAYEIRDTYAPRPLDTNPTQTIPGSEEKILLMMDRAKRGVQLFHPDEPSIEIEHTVNLASRLTGFKVHLPKESKQPRPIKTSPIPKTTEEVYQVFPHGRFLSVQSISRRWNRHQKLVKLLKKIHRQRKAKHARTLNQQTEAPSEDARQDTGGESIKTTTPSPESMPCPLQG